MVKTHGVALLFKLLERLYPQVKFWKVKSSEVFDFLGVGFESLSCSQWLSSFTVPPYVPWMGHLCVLPASNLSLQEDCWWWLVLSSCSKRARCSHFMHKKKNESTLREPEKTVHLKILLNYGWYLGQGALKAGKCSLRPRQMWVCWRPHASVHPPYWKRHSGFLVRLTCSVRFDWHSVCFSAGKFLVSSVTAFIDSGEKSNPVKDNEAKNNWLRVMLMSCESLL